jgi:hypothetical protein
MKKVILAFAALGEAAAGVVLLAYPTIAVRLLFGVEITGAGLVMSRVVGICFIALGVACWPGTVVDWPLCGMLTYSILVMLYLVVIGFGGEFLGKLLWPAVALHATLTILLLWAWSRERKTRERSQADSSPAPAGRGTLSRKWRGLGSK